MENMKYTLPYPDIRNRRQDRAPWVEYGDVLAFEYCGRTGIMFMEGRFSFLFAVNLYEEDGRIWTSDEVPEGIAFYESTVEERIWCMEMYLEMMSCCCINYEHGLPLIRFIEMTCPAGDPYNSRSDWKFCFKLLSLAPWFQFVKNKGETARAIWQEVKKGITDTGLSYNANRTELYCFLMGVLMIADSDCECEDLQYCPDEHRNISPHDKCAFRNIEKLCQNWDHFSWMYAMVIGRIVGTTLNTFTAMVNNLQNSKRVGYLHLYLPLVERNIEKICRYSPTEKSWKLKQAIEKMKTVEQLQGQKDDLDDLYQIVFPSYFQETMSKNRPSSTISELKAELAEKAEQMNSWKQMAESLAVQVNTLTSSMEVQINQSLSMRDVSAAILSMKPDIRDIVFSNLDRKLRKNKVWIEGREELVDKLEELEKTEQAQPSMNDNNGIVAGGNFDARISLTDNQARIIAERLAAKGNAKQLE